MSISIKTPKELIKFISENQISDYEQIQTLCQGMFNKTFLPIQFGTDSRGTNFYLHHLRNYANEIDGGINNRSFIDMPEPFNIKDIFN